MKNCAVHRIQIILCKSYMEHFLPETTQGLYTKGSCIQKVLLDFWVMVINLLFILKDQIYMRRKLARCSTH